MTDLNIRIIIFTSLLVSLVGCVSIPQSKKSELFTYIPTNNPEVAIQKLGYLTEVEGCLQYRYRGQIKTPIFPDGKSFWNKELGTITVGENTIKLDELFSYGGTGIVSESELVSAPNSKCMLTDKVKLSSVDSHSEDITMNPKYKYSSFTVPNIDSKFNSGVFTYQPDQTAKIEQIGTIQDMGKPNCLYFLNGSEVATPVFPKGTVWNKDSNTITMSDSTIKIGADNKITVQTTGALPSNSMNFLTVGDSDCLELLTLPIQKIIS